MSRGLSALSVEQEAAMEAAALVLMAEYRETPAQEADRHLQSRSYEAAAARRELASAQRMASVQPTAERLARLAVAEHRAFHAGCAVDEARRALAAAKALEADHVP